MHGFDGEPLHGFKKKKIFRFLFLLSIFKYISHLFFRVKTYGFRILIKAIKQLEHNYINVVAAFFINLPNVLCRLHSDAPKVCTPTRGRAPVNTFINGPWRNFSKAEILDLDF